jgi:DNA topoisomerase-2
MLGAEAAKLTNQARFIVEKCDGDLRIENRKKTEMVKELVRRGYNSDPVKAWKLIQDRESVLLDEAQRLAEETEEDEAAPSTSTTSSKEDENLDYDYLLGMSFWHLTLEKKNELLRKKEEKCTELDILKKKSPNDLWLEDLDMLLEKLDEVEEKERLEELGDEFGKSKGSKSKALSGKKKTQLAADSLPSPAAKRVIPKIDEEMVKKEEKLIAAKENKGKRTIKKKKDEVDGEGGENEIKKEKKERKPAAPRKKTEGLKQTKLKFTKVDDDDDDGSLSDVPPSPPPPRTVSKRQAAANISFKFESGDEDDPGVKSDHSDDSFKAPSTHNLFSDDAISDDEFKRSKKKESPKKAVKKEPTTKKEPATKKQPATKRAPAKKNNGTNNDLNEESGPVIKPIVPPKRATAQKKPVIEISDDDFDDYDDVIPVSKPEKKTQSSSF